MGFLLEHQQISAIYLMGMMWLLAVPKCARSQPRMLGSIRLANPM
jgi:hypothetical protein